MLLTENLRLALRSLTANKLRAMLTMLGITIGIAAVVVLLSVGDAVSRYVADQFSGLGSNLLFVFPGQFEPGGGPPGRRTGDVALTERDLRVLSDRTLVPDAALVVPFMGRSAQVSNGRNAANSPLRATTPDYFPIRNYTVAEGRFFNSTDMDASARVAVIGQTTLRKLFAPDENPIGTSIRINGSPFRIIGVFDEKPRTAFGDDNDAIIIPYTTGIRNLFANSRTREGNIRLSVIFVQAADPNRQTQLIQQMKDALRQERNIGFAGEDDFTVLSQQDLVSAFQAITGVLTVFLGAIASISLLVGGIGIMNIMLVSVTERTKEIGLRKAVGARRAHVLTQFLVEAVVLSLMGAAIGVAIGATGIFIIAQVVPDLAPTVTPDSVVLAIGFASAVGLFFGIYPAYRASGLSPIEALRYD